MDFSFTPEQDQIREHLRALLSVECSPDYAAKCDEDARPPREAYDALAKNGWFGLIVPPEYGGTGGNAREGSRTHGQWRGSCSVSS